MTSSRKSAVGRRKAQKENVKKSSNWQKKKHAEEKCTDVEMKDANVNTSDNEKEVKVKIEPGFTENIPINSQQTKKIKFIFVVVGAAG